jgi:hypothetical protein
VLGGSSYGGWWPGRWSYWPYYYTPECETSDDCSRGLCLNGYCV